MARRLRTIQQHKSAPPEQEMTNFLLLSYSAARNPIGIVPTPKQEAFRLEKRKNIMLLLNGVVGIVLYIIQMELEFSGNHLVENSQSTIVKYFSTVTTIILLLQLSDYYSLQVGVSKSEWENRSALQIESANLISRHFISSYAAEIIVCAIHPPPYFSTFVDDKVFCFMFLRLYLVFRVLRDHTTVYKMQQSITKSTYSRASAPVFDWYLSLKTIYYSFPVTIMISGTVLLTIVTGYVCYIFEREVDPEKWSFWAGTYATFISLITGWPTDTWIRYDPTTTCGRLACIVAVLGGYFGMAGIINNAFNFLVLNPHEEAALIWVLERDIQQQEEHFAAGLIQSVWKVRKARSSQRSFQAVPLPSKWTKLEIKYSKAFRQVQRTKAEMGHMFSKGKEEKPLRQLLSRMETIEDENRFLRHQFSEINRSLHSIQSLLETNQLSQSHDHNPPRSPPSRRSGVPITLAEILPPSSPLFSKSLNINDDEM